MRQYSQMSASTITTMHCGGNIARLFEPETKDQLRALLAEFDDFIMLGGGSNMIFEDALISSPVIRLGKGFDTVSRSKENVCCGAALLTSRLLNYCEEHGLSGLEFLAWIPGTVGGALFMNAGTAQRGIMDEVIDIEVMDKEGTRYIPRSDLNYGYRTGGFSPDTVITGARFAMKSAPREQIFAAVESFRKKRRDQPSGYSCGSVFKNPPHTSAGQLIEQAGMKGFAIGGAKVSQEHANFIINDGTATATDILDLIRTIKNNVRERFGIELVEEVRIIGKRL
ncbi:MAG TPA: UDP-N-acetylmuramate dehydrogenase [Deltaproteobacteria bacterium]|nr:UDP-N-acetylmuramate dehydrogenase [Deltaproteobacteria bacterium]